jgi:hypothetical protein
MKQDLQKLMPSALLDHSGNFSLLRGKLISILSEIVSTQIPASFKMNESSSKEQMARLDLGEDR